MVGTKDKMQRRVYVLPTDLVERIVEIQKDQGFSSEVDVVRWLLEDAVWRHDTADTILARYRERIISGYSAIDAAKECLIGHPKISNFSIGHGAGISIEIQNYGKFALDMQGRVTKVGEDGSETEYLPPVRG